MNLINSRILLNMMKRVDMCQCLYKIEGRSSLHNKSTIKAVKQLKFMKPDYFEMYERYKKRKHRGSIGIYGYFLLGIPIVTFYLGTWQVQRRKWKLNLIDELQKRTTAEPVELPENLNELESIEYYPVRVKGQFLYDKELFIEPRSLIKQGKESQSSLFSSRGNIGRLVVTPFKLENRDLTILVNRGWIPKSKDQSPNQIKDTTEIVGIVRTHEKRPPFAPKNASKSNTWFYRDVELMAKLTGASPVYLDLWSTNDSPGGPISRQTTIELRNEHLSYILVWYLLSAFTGYLWFRTFIQKLPLR